MQYCENLKAIKYFLLLFIFLYISCMQEYEKYEETITIKLMDKCIQAGILLIVYGYILHITEMKIEDT